MNIYLEYLFRIRREIRKITFTNITNKKQKITKPEI